MVNVNFHKSPVLEQGAKAPEQKEMQGAIIPRKQRRKREQELRRRAKKHRPLVEGDYRWQKLKEDELQQCLDAFKRQAEYCKFAQQCQFVMTWPMTPAIKDYCKENNIQFVQHTRYQWVIVVPAATAQEAFEYKLNKAIESNVEVIFVSSQDENTDYIRNNPAVDYVIEDDKVKGAYVVVLKRDGIVHKHWHEGITIDEIILIDAFNAGRTNVTVHANETTAKLIEDIANKFDTIEDINVLETMHADMRIYRLTVTYKPANENDSANRWWLAKV